MNLAVKEDYFPFKFITESAADAFILINADGSIGYMNHTALTGGGYVATDVATLRVQSVLPIFTNEFLASLFAQDKPEEIPLVETFYQRKDNSTYPVEIKLGTIEIKNKLQLLAIVKDITAGQLAGNVKQERYTRFQQILKQAPTGITILRGNDFVVEMANEAYLRVVDRTEAQLVGKPLFEGMPEVKDTVQPLLQEVVKTGIPFHGIEYPVPLARFGKVQVSYFDFLYHPLKEEDGTISGIMVTVSDVTDNVKAKHAVSESEKQFRRMFVESPIAMAIFRGPEFIIEVANAKMLKELWRRTEEEAIGKKLLTVFPELEAQEYPSLLKEVYNTGIPQSRKEALAIVNASDGLKRFYVDYHYAPLLETDGSSSGIMVTVNDVTEKVEARKKIEESELFNRTVLESSPDCVKVLNHAGEITFINLNGICILEGEKKEEFVGREWINMWAPQVKPAVKVAVEKALQGDTNQFIALSPTMKGTPKWWNVHVTPVLDGEGNVMSVLATSRDITAEKNSEIELKESEQKFRLLADSMPQFVWTADAEGNLNYFNQSVYQYSGLTAESMRDDGWIQIVHPDDVEANIRTWTNAVSSGADFLFEHRFRRADGAFRWQLSRAIAKRDAKGNIQMWVGTSTDIEDQKTFTNELERQVQDRTKELADSNIELAKMNKELESFAYISSHDLQEPLRKIQTFANQILEKEAERLSEVGRDKFQRMQNSAKRMQTLIEDLLNYSRTSNAKREFVLTDLNLILAEVKDDLRDELLQKNAIIETGELCHASIITFQFRQLLYNLIRNSLKFSTLQGRPLIKIATKNEPGNNLPHPGLQPKQRYCHICVADNGIGFEQTYNEKIFEVFQRLHGRNEYEGTGIGLAIVKKIVDNHHGIIEATGVPGEGARFDIYLPVPEN